MMLAACSVNEDNPSGDIPVPTESYETVLNYFKEVNAVPRPSRHEEKMREYLREFAQDRGLRLIEDNGNIIIYKDATTGIIILQKSSPTSLNLSMSRIKVDNS